MPPGPKSHIDCSSVEPRTARSQVPSSTHCAASGVSGMESLLRPTIRWQRLSGASWQHTWRLKLMQARQQPKATSRVQCPEAQIFHRQALKRLRRSPQRSRPEPTETPCNSRPQWYWPWLARPASDQGAGENLLLLFKQTGSDLADLALLFNGWSLSFFCTPTPLQQPGPQNLLPRLRSYTVSKSLYWQSWLGSCHFG